MNRFEGKTVVVTGSARGQGAAEIRRFHLEGANVVVSDLITDAGKTLAESLGERAIFIRHDVSSESWWRELFGKVEQTFGGCDVLVNNAGVYQPATIAETDTELMGKMFRVNQLGVLLRMKYAAEPTKRRGGGSIINISSVIGCAVRLLPWLMSAPNGQCAAWPKSPPMSLPRTRSGVIRYIRVTSSLTCSRPMATRATTRERSPHP